IGRPELVEQPAGVVDTAILDQRIEQRLVVAALRMVAQEPAEAFGAGTLVLDEVAGQVHGDAPVGKIMSRALPLRSGSKSARAVEDGRHDPPLFAHAACASKR